MKTKTINKLITKKFNQLLNSIDDEDVKKAVAAGTIMTGGAIASMLMKEPVNDYDFYFKDKSTALAVAQYYVERFNRAHEGRAKVFAFAQEDRIVISLVPKENTDGNAAVTPTYFEQFTDKVKDEGEDCKFDPVFMTTNAITLSGDVQLVIRFYGSPEEIHENYDFIHCTNYWASDHGKLALNKEALESILTKELRYVGSKYPLCSVIRLRKFIARGWSINAGQILKILMQLNELDLLNVGVLQEQLVGVDSAYFIQLLEAIKKDHPEKVNASYLGEVIDRIF